MRQWVVSHLKVYIKGLKASLQIDLNYKVDFFAEVFRGLFKLLSFFILVQVLFLQVDEIYGFGKNDLLFLYGFYDLNKNLYEAFFYNLKEIGFTIKQGDLDFLLTKPKNTIVLIIANSPFIFYIPDLIISLGLIIYATVLGVNLSLPVVLFSFLLSPILFFSIDLIVASIQFVALFPNSGQQLAREITSFGRNPHSFFNNTFKNIFVFITPIFLFGSIVFYFSKQNVPTILLINVFVIIICIFYLSVKLWKNSIKSYTSASS